VCKEETVNAVNYWPKNLVEKNRGNYENYNR
jgi:hypothetical protein